MYVLDLNSKGKDYNWKTVNFQPVENKIVFQPKEKNDMTLIPFEIGSLYPASSTSFFLEEYVDKKTTKPKFVRITADYNKPEEKKIEIQPGEGAVADVGETETQPLIREFVEQEENTDFMSVPPAGAPSENWYLEQDDPFT